MTAEEVEVTGAVTERLFGALLGAIELATVHLGVRLGLYDALAAPRTAAGLAQAAGIDERYAREWLEQQAISGLVSVVEPGDGDSRVYGLDPEQAASFGDPDSPAYAGSMALVMGGVGQVLPLLPEVYRTGVGDPVRWLRRRRPARAGPVQPRRLPRPADPGVGARPARRGRAPVASRRPGARPRLRRGLVEHRARRGVPRPRGARDRQRRRVGDGRAGQRRGARCRRPGPLRGGRRRHPARRAAYDVAFYFEALHDMAHPVESLAAVRSALRPGGVVVVVDEGAEEEFAPGGSEVERILAASSVLHCLPVGRSQPDSEATGALFRPATMRSYAARAGLLRGRGRPDRARPVPVLRADALRRRRLRRCPAPGAGKRPRQTRVSAARASPMVATAAAPIVVAVDDSGWRGCCACRTGWCRVARCSITVATTSSSSVGCAEGNGPCIL